MAREQQNDYQGAYRVVQVIGLGTLSEHTIYFGPWATKQGAKTKMRELESRNTVARRWSPGIDELVPAHIEFVSGVWEKVEV